MPVSKLRKPPVQFRFDRAVFDRRTGAAYLSIGVRNLDELVRRGVIKTLAAPAVVRPNARTRRVLFAKVDLDQLVESWRVA